MKCVNCKTEFEITQDDKSFYEKMGVCRPNMCPDCRSQLRLSFRNERVLYKRECDKCKKSIVSMYSPNKPFPVYCRDCFYSSDWGAEDYALEYDENKPFFEQFEELWKKVPRIALIYVRSPESEYTNLSADNKNCYFIIESSNNEDSIHSYWIQECKDVIDTSFSSRCELMYECDDCYNSYKLLYSKGCHDCTTSYFLNNCRGCTDCHGCVNLRNKSNCIFNEQYTKKEYKEKLKEFKLDTNEGVDNCRRKYEEFLKTQPKKYAEIVQGNNSTGNYIKNTKNCKNCFHCYDAEDSRYGLHVWRNAKDVMDVSTAGRDASLIYNSINTGMGVANIVCGTLCWSSTFINYSMNCHNSNYLLGCIGLRKKDYCILNKQYSKQKYEEIIQKIKEEIDYGNFFSKNLSDFGYNETSAQEEFPLSKKEAVSFGFKWEDTERGTYNKGSNDKNPIKKIFTCINCDKNYKIIPNELSFYNRLNIFLPQLCPDCRHFRRMKNRGENKLYKGNCDKCNIEFETPHKEGIIYCESCYNDHIL